MKRASAGAACSALLLALSLGAAAASAQQPAKPDTSTPAPPPAAYPPADQAPLSLDDAVTAALATHPSLESAQAAVDRVDAARMDARAAWLPSLSLDVGVMRYEKPMVVAPLHGFDPRNLPAFDRDLQQGGISLGWTAFDGGARRARYGRARALEFVTLSGQEAVRLRLLSDVARAYLRVRATREVADANAHQVAALTAERDRAARVLAQGRTPRVTVLRAEAGLAQAQAQLEAARMDADVAERDLARLMGVPGERVAGAPLPQLHLTTPEPDRPVALARALESSPDVVALRRQEDAARAGVRESRSLWMPRLQLVGRYGQFGSSEFAPTREWQGGVQLSYPLFTGGSRLAAGERADAEVRAARADLAQAQLRVASAVDQALTAVRSARARVTALESAVQQSEEVARIEKLALDAGSGVQTDYLTAEAQLLGARASLTEARAAAAAARIELARVTGELSRDWLRRNLDGQESNR